MKKNIKFLVSLFCYCGVPKDEYNSIKKQAYISNFQIWSFLYNLMMFIFAGASISTIFTEGMNEKVLAYFAVFIFSFVSWILFRFAFKQDSIWAQLWIYLAMIVLLCFGLWGSLNKPAFPATSLLAIIVILPMFMLDKPYFMAILLGISCIICLWHSLTFKVDLGRSTDVINLITYSFIGIVINTFYNTFRVRELLLAKSVKLQRDTDDLTGTLRRRPIVNIINKQIVKDKQGAMMIIDIDNFKQINDNYGHDIGDKIIVGIGEYLLSQQTDDIKVGRFGGDEFIVVFTGTNDEAEIVDFALKLRSYVNENVHTPNRNEIVGTSIGIAICSPDEKDYDSLFKKADTALYMIKNGSKNDYCVFNRTLFNIQ